MAVHRAWKDALASVNAKFAEQAPDSKPLVLTWYEATRHSFVSRNLAAGASLDEVSAAIGHSSPVLTQRFYNRFVRKTFSSKLRAGLGSGSLFLTPPASRSTSSGS